MLESAAKRIKWWVWLIAVVLATVAGGSWEVAAKVYGMEGRIGIMESTHRHMEKQIDWMTQTLWNGRPVTKPPEPIREFGPEEQ